MATLLFLVTRIRYVVDDDHVRVVFFGQTVRKIALTDIEEVRAGRPFWNEHWENTLWTFGRSVTIRRKSGWIRNVVISPRDRDEFIRDLKSRLVSRAPSL